MKNIHLIKTDKPSRLHLWTDENGTRPALCELEYSHTRNTQHIYITSDEKAKEGDWGYIPFQGGNVKLVGKYFADDWKKIILTTDQDLIKDGVQAIDDEFLEWFVKNPSCEEVEVVDDLIITQDKPLIQHQGSKPIVVPHRIGYKIIIPKEETTAYHYLSCCRSIEECHCGKYPKQIKCYCGHTIMCDCSPIDESKQETLEESAERIAMTKDWDFESSEGNGYYDYVEGFTEGAKSDAARDYWYAKWQQEKSYSEEDMLDFAWYLIKNVGQYSDDRIAHFEGKYLEQFKKK